MISGLWSWERPQVSKRLREIKTNKLSIKLKDGIILSWMVDDWKGTIMNRPWIQFYKWFFGRPQSDIFVMRSTTSETLIRRESIAFFEIVISGKLVEE